MKQAAGYPTVSRPVSYSSPEPKYAEPVPSYAEPAPKYAEPAPKYAEPLPKYAEPLPKYPEPYVPYEQPLHNCTVQVGAFSWALLSNPFKMNANGNNISDCHCTYNIARGRQTTQRGV